MCFQLFLICCAVKPKVFVSELGEAIGVKLSTSNMGSLIGDKGVVGAAAGSCSKSMPESLDEMTDVSRLAAKAGFVVNEYVELKKKGLDSKDTAGIWKIEGVTNNGCSLVEMVTSGEAAKKNEVEYKVLLDDWKVHKGKVCMELSGVALAKPLLSAEWQIAAARGAITVCLRKHYANNDNGFNFLSTFAPPLVVRAKSHVPKGELNLVAASLKIERKYLAGAVSVGSFDVMGSTTEFYVTPHTVLPYDKHGTRNANGWISHFWLVEVSGSDDDVNCELKFVTENVGDISVKVPVITNRRVLKVGDVLKRANVTRVSGVKKPRTQ